MGVEQLGVIATWNFADPGAFSAPLGKKVRTWLSAVLMLPSWLASACGRRSPEPPDGLVLTVVICAGGVQ